MAGTTPSTPARATILSSGDAGPGALGVGGGSSTTKLDVGSLSGNTLTTDDGSVRATVDFGAPGGFGGWEAIPVGFNKARDELFFATGVLEDAQQHPDAELRRSD